MIWHDELQSGTATIFAPTGVRNSEQGAEFSRRFFMIGH